MYQNIPGLATEHPDLNQNIQTYIRLSILASSYRNLWPVKKEAGNINMISIISKVNITIDEIFITE